MFGEQTFAQLRTGFSPCIPGIVPRRVSGAELTPPLYVLAKTCSFETFLSLIGNYGH